MIEYLYRMISMNFLVYYYNDAYYDLEFVTIAGAFDKLILEEESEDFIIVLPNITQHGRIRIGSEIFGANIARAPHGYGSIQVTHQVDLKYSGQVIKFM